MVKSFIYNQLYQWYEANHRILPWRETEDAYCIWLSEVILQQTRVAQGMEYYLRFVARWPRVEDLAAADEADVLREWQGLGYYSRARNLHKAAQQIVESQKSKVESGKQDGYVFPKTFEEIRSLPGIGDYTAGAISSFAYNAPYPAMDGNVYRVVARLLDINEPFDTTAGKKLFRKQIEELMDRDHPRLFNSAIMEFGALQCTPSNVQRDKVQCTKDDYHLLNEKCPLCPLADVCLGYAHGTADLLPVRKARPKVKDRWLTYQIYVQRDKVQGTKGEGTIYTLIRRRENPKDIWYHLYEFPCEEFLEEPSAVGSLPLAFTHVLSHQKLHARFMVHAVDELPQIEGTIVIPWSDLDNYALSRLTLRALDIIQRKA